MKRQPDLDRRAIHHFYGSQLHYIVLFFLTFILLSSLLLSLRELYRLQQSEQTQAMIHYNMNQNIMGSGKPQPILKFHDANMRELSYWVNDPKFAAQLDGFYDQLSMVPVRYRMATSGEVASVEIIRTWNSWGEALMYAVIALLCMYGLWQLSPRPRWYWQQAGRRFSRLSQHYILLEVRVKQLKEVKHRHGQQQRLCSMTGAVYIHTQNTYVDVESACFMVEPQFRMSYPLMAVYFNPKNVYDYEIDLMSFLKHNASALHGFTEYQRQYSHADEYVAS